MDVWAWLMARRAGLLGPKSRGSGGAWAAGTARHPCCWALPVLQLPSFPALWVPAALASIPFLRFPGPPNRSVWLPAHWEPLVILQSSAEASLPLRVLPWPPDLPWPPACPSTQHTLAMGATCMAAAPQDI